VPDVLIIGGGIIGCAAAEALTTQGAQVQVVDPRGIGEGATQASAGMRVSIAMLRSLAGIELVEVPYKGQPQALNDLLGGQIDFTFDLGAAIPHIKSQKVRLLAVPGAEIRGGESIDVGHPR